jgi:3-oxoacyl-[acyl-carrier protein] reductase
MVELDGKVALVTGGSRGIGAAISRRLAEGGADVGFTYLRDESQARAVVGAIEATGRRSWARQLDAANASTVQQIIGEVVSHFGRLDILVNNAGIFPSGPLEDVTVEEVDRTLAVHLRTVFVASQAAARHMKDGGRIISTKARPSRGSCASH